MATTESVRDNATAEENEGYEVQVVITQQLLGEDERKRHLKLLRAAVSGDWRTAKAIFRDHPDDIRARISKAEDTPLHVAAAANHTHFVEQMINNKHMNSDDLEMRNQNNNTAFCLAAACGHMKLVNLMLKKNSKLAQIRGVKRMLPIQMAALLGHENMVRHLYEDIETPFEGKDLIELLVALINRDFYDTALILLKDYPDLATERAGNEETALHALAKRPLTSSYLANPNQQGSQQSLFNLFSGTNMVHNKKMHPKAVELVKRLWEQVIMLSDVQISRQIGYPWQLLFVAAELGNFQLLSILIDNYPELIFKHDGNGYSIFHFAVLNRHERIFNLIHETGSIKDTIVVLEDRDKNNILHLAAKLPPPNRLNVVSGAALQLQRELLWFREVQTVVQPLYAEAKNNDGKTPRALFTEEHKELMGKGEEWMKKTAESCMIVATLIATVVFAAAFTVPGGVKEDTGSPNFLKKVSFIIFSISDPISLVSSSCSILTFLSILTARYAEEDFLWSLPTKLVVGISTLFISIAAMMVVFCVTFFILFNEGMQELAILATALASIPVFLFLWQQCRLLLDVIRWTYTSNSLFHNRKKMLFKHNDIPEGDSLLCGFV